MSWSHTCGRIILAIGFAYASNFLYSKFLKISTTPKKEINEVIMFSHGDADYRRSKYSRCKITQSMEKLLFHMNSPRYNLDICMYVFTNMDLSNAILKLHYKGVKIRIIIDADMAYSQGSSIKRMEKQGIPVRWMKSTNLMHHKFCLVDCTDGHMDAVPRVISGSLNWTNQALYGNWENVIVTSQIDIVSQYKMEFERLWVQFKPIVGFV